jgi:transcriptional regulator with XRE-family HTH domain
MDPQKRAALEAAGYQFTDAATYVGLTDEERTLQDARFELAKAVRRQREARNLTQKQLAERIGSSQPRVALLERAAPGVTFDLILKALAAVGVQVVVNSRAADPLAAERSAAAAKGKKRPRPRTKPTRPAARVEIELIGTDG